MMRISLLVAPLIALGLTAPAALAQTTQGSVSLEDLPETDVVFLGEIHDNPSHHTRQAELVAQIAPVAVVYEMLTTDQAAQIHPEDLADETALAELLDWENSGWPDFSMYYPIFEASGEAAIFGAALPREEARAVDGRPVGEVFGPSAGFYGLDEPLPGDMQNGCSNRGAGRRTASGPASASSAWLAGPSSYPP